MIIQQCDICKRYTTIYDTMILHKKSIDYCLRCKPKADALRKEFKQEADKKLEALEEKKIKNLYKKGECK